MQAQEESSSTGLDAASSSDAQTPSPSYELSDKEENAGESRGPAPREVQRADRPATAKQSRCFYPQLLATAEVLDAV